MGLQRGGDLVAMVGPCNGGAVLEAPLEGGGGGGGSHIADPVSGESRPTSLASILGARGSVGRPRGPIQMCVVCLYAGLLGGDSGTGMTSTGSLSSSSSATVTSTTSSTSVTPSSPYLSPSPGLGEDNTDRLSATGYEHGPIPWVAQGGSWRPHGEVATERWPGLRVPSTNRLVVQGRETMVVA
jgi:hypothetical protein